METMTIYLAGPIDGVSEDEARGWRRQVIESAPTGCLFFDPSSAWGGASAATAEALDQGNRGVLYNCDGVLVNLSGPGRGFGTIRELEFGRGQGKPVAVAEGDHQIVSFLKYDLMVATTVDQAFTLLLEAIRARQDRPRMLMIPLPNMPQDGDDAA